MQHSGEDFRAAMARLPAPVAVVSTFDADHRARGFTASAVSWLSRSPPLLMVCLGHGNRSRQAFLAAPRFLVSLLTEQQGALARWFATARPDKFDTAETNLLELGLPGVVEAAVRIACQRKRTIDVGDHTILIGRVVRVTHGDQPPLVYHAHHFHGLRPLIPITAVS